MATAFGTQFASTMSTSRWSEDGFAEPVLGPVEPIPMHPAAHVLHYSSTCFEGMKAHKGSDGQVRIFRGARHVERMQQSAAQLRLAVPPTELLHGMIRDVVAKNASEVPDSPGALYIRPMLFGTMPNIGAAAAPSSEGWLIVLPSPVGDYFAGGLRPLKLLVETSTPRTTPHFGMVKSGANYVQALPITLDAKAKYGVDQILFAPDGDVQETGAANFLLIDDDRVVTRNLDSSFLHGVTRDSILTLARDLGYKVEERSLSVDEVLAWKGEAALSGTAAVLAPVGTLLHNGTEHQINNGEVGPNIVRLRDALLAVQRGEAPDTHGWTEAV
ncbi:MAG: branched-chain amino acid aminotransferase [Glaciecola sp.]|jgi:branched-chain amino acid aminotransferase